jgi:hypothetical protein
MSAPPSDACFSTGAKSKNVGAADQTSFGAERQRPQYIMTGADAAIEQHFDIGAGLGPASLKNKPGRARR